MVYFALYCEGIIQIKNILTIFSKAFAHIFLENYSSTSLARQRIFRDRLNQLDIQGSLNYPLILSRIRGTFDKLEDYQLFYICILQLFIFDLILCYRRFSHLNLSNNSLIYHLLLKFQKIYPYQAFCHSNPGIILHIKG